MKIRAITLHNVRRFAAQTARLSGISDGVTTICEPNETGKSTFFDALHALFFIDHKANTAELRTLQPYSKGPVEIAVEIETEGGRFRIEKKFLSSKSAVVTNLASEAIIAQEGEAEAWISKTIGAEMSGPAGLLWVRQGVTGFGPNGTGQTEKRERERLREARQSLMSTVAGQIDSVTGGRRMDEIMKAVSEDLDNLATKNLSAKSNGEWGKAKRLAEDLSAEHDQLESQVTALSKALRRRSEIRRKLDDQSAVETQAARKAELAHLNEQLEKAQQHAKLVSDAERDLTFTELMLKSIKDKIAERSRHVARRQRLVEDAEKAAKMLEELKAAAASTQESFGKAERYHEATADVLRRARDVERKAARAREISANLRRREEISRLLERVASVEVELKEAREALKANPLTAAAFAEIEHHEREISKVQARRDAGATTLQMSYAGSARASISGADIEGDRTIPVYVETLIDLPDIGCMTLSPAVEGGDQIDTDTLRAQLDDMLRKVGCVDTTAARAMVRANSEAKSKEASALAALNALVPDGTDEIRRELADLPKRGEVQELPKENLDLPSVSEAEAAEEETRRALRDARATRDESANDLLEAKTTHRLAHDALAQFDKDAQSAPKEDLETPLKDAEVKVARAEETRAALVSAAPDVEALEADRDRLSSALRVAQEERSSAREELSQLDGEIGARADDGVEVRLEEVRGELQEAVAREARYAFEVKILATLRDELDRARSEARDAYFEPVKRELIPLIAMLHEGAELEMDPETMLPARIRRGLVVEEIDVLSGGAIEQIAILTRLAFARLYARQGRQVPVILDDALVHSDDDRIVRMFTALTRISRDQQIIVFTCRNRAFEELGGHRPRIEVETTKR
ncbi:AAA family ATPase [Roseibium sp. SCP14]|uniref:AAA family ATPase n=1 Tax=Roseibium sp. SCP14 TaxID=3141375 RepID=UPI00333A8DD1